MIRACVRRARIGRIPYNGMLTSNLLARKHELIHMHTTITYRLPQLNFPREKKYL